MVPDCTLVTVPDITAAYYQLEALKSSLLLVHLTPQTGSMDALFVQGVPRIPKWLIVDGVGPSYVLSLLRRGCTDCIFRPLNINRLAYLIDLATCRQRFLDEADSDDGRGSATTPCEVTRRIGELVYSNAGDMSKIVEQVRRVAPLMTTVLLDGETGTGKTSLAKSIHQLSCRCDKPFLVVNCGALSPTLVESEIFGHVKGAFTGAERDHEGKFAAAGEGTLLLDEIDSLPLDTQPKLLRALDERLFEPVGSSKSLPLKARLVVATNRNLEKEVEEGRFRVDLFYRINVVRFTLPPLRQRRAVIPTLVRQALHDFAARNRVPVPTISASAMTALLAHDWPGNVRELRNEVERTASLCTRGAIDVADLSPHICAAGPSRQIMPAADDLRAHRIQSEIESIRRALEKSKNNRARAAQELGISRVTLYKKLHKYCLFFNPAAS
jgi:transcriptional regulator with PAS, ATPase and Fis domain